MKISLSEFIRLISSMEEATIEVYADEEAEGLPSWVDSIEGIQQAVTNYYYEDKFAPDHEEHTTCKIVFCNINVRKLMGW